MMMKSVKRSVAVKQVSISSVSTHCVRKKLIGAQFQSQRVPHWNKVAKKNAINQALMTPIITQQRITKCFARANIRFQRKRIDNLISPNAIFSVVWKAYLYF